MRVTHPQLRPGNACPGCKQGKLYALKQLGQLVRITAQPLFAATRFELEKLRCNLCGQLFTAPAPKEAGLSKYDPQVGPMLGPRYAWPSPPVTQAILQQNGRSRKAKKVQ